MGEGTRGAWGLFELLPIDEDLARKIVETGNEGDISRLAREKKIPGLAMMRREVAWRADEL